MRPTTALLCFAAALVLLDGCVSVPRLHRAPRRRPFTLERVPDVEEFETLLRQKAPLIEVLFSVDAMMQTDLDRAAVRELYAALLAKAAPLAEAARFSGGAHGAALEIMGLLRAEGFAYSSAIDGWATRYGSVSEALRTRKGLCLSFTMLTLALLDSCGMKASAVNYPQHVLVRVRDGDREIELESTNYGDPVAAVYPPELFDRAREEGFIYGRSLDRTGAAWLYMVDRITGWLPLRSKDPRSFGLMERAEAELLGTTEVICAQWALRHYARTTRPILDQEERAESARAAVAEYERLANYDPRSAFYALMLSRSHDQAGNPQASLRALKTYLDANPGGKGAMDVMLRTFWYSRREASTPEEKAEGERFLKLEYSTPEFRDIAERKFLRMVEFSDR